MDDTCFIRSSSGGLAGNRGAAVFLVAVALAGGAMAAGCGPDRAAPRPMVPLHETFPSAEAAGRHILDTLAAAGDAMIDHDALVRTLSPVALSEDEFRDVVWPELPSSRTDVGLPFDYAWRDLHQKSRNELIRTVRRYAGRRLELVEVGFEGETTEYDSFVVHRDTYLVVRDAEGREDRIRLFGAMLKRGHEFKVFSWVVD